ncbi:MAG TPA: peptide chain release factor-like protein [Candidatus Binatia bacterium]|nr:peptide chain release factor-like protein [Candidatus Binatia bacterium]
MSDTDGIDFHHWPPRECGGQQVATPHRGVIAVHRDTGLAVLCESERSQHANRTIAAAKLRAVLDVWRDADISNASPRDFLP